MCLNSLGGNFVFIFFFPFHSSILEPNFDLSLSQRQNLCNFDSSSASQIAIEMKFFFEFECLMSRISSSSSFARIQRFVCIK